MQCHHAPLSRCSLRVCAPETKSSSSSSLRQPDPTGQMRFCDSWGSTLPWHPSPLLASTLLHPPTSLATHSATCAVTDSWLAEAWHSAYTTPSPSTQALSIKRHWRGSFRCVWTRGWGFQPCRLLFTVPRGWGENQAFSPQPCGSAAWPLDVTPGLSYMNAVWWRESVAVGWFPFNRDR